MGEGNAPGSDGECTNIFIHKKYGTQLEDTPKKKKKSTCYAGSVIRNCYFKNHPCDKLSCLK